MIDLISVSNMRESDAYTIANEVSDIELMRRAAQGLLMSYDYPLEGTAIFTGSGNNGGDGYALAFLLSLEGKKAVVFALSEAKTDSARHFKDLACKADVEIRPVGDFDPREFKVCVDCLLGTGFSGDLRQDYKEAVDKINKSGNYVISADINSGMNGNSGEYSDCVRSDLTVSIGFLKKGMITPSALKAIGSLAVVDIGIRLLRKEEEIDESIYKIKLIESK